jgi:hypothetical protein
MPSLRQRLGLLEERRLASGPIVLAMSDGRRETIHGDPVRLFRRAAAEDAAGHGFTRDIQLIKDSVSDVEEPRDGRLIEVARALLNSPQEPGGEETKREGVN